MCNSYTESQVWLVSFLGSAIQLREVSAFDEDPLYDSVASDDDYATVPEDKEKSPQMEHTSSTNKDSVISLHNINTTNQMLIDMIAQLKTSDNTITDLKSQVSKLRQHIEKLEYENCELKNRLSQTKPVVSRINGDSGFESLGFISEVRINFIWFLSFKPI